MVVHGRVMWSTPRFAVVCFGCAWYPQVSFGCAPVYNTYVMCIYRHIYVYIYTLQFKNTVTAQTDTSDVHTTGIRDTVYPATVINFH